MREAISSCGFETQNKFEAFAEWMPVDQMMAGEPEKVSMFHNFMTEGAEFGHRNDYVSSRKGYSSILDQYLLDITLG